MGSGPDHAHLPPVVLDDQEFVPGGRPAVGEVVGVLLLGDPPCDVRGQCTPDQSVGQGRNAGPSVEQLLFALVGCRVVA